MARPRRGRLSVQQLVDASRRQMADLVQDILRVRVLPGNDSARLAWYVCWFVTGNDFDNRAPAQPLTGEEMDALMAHLSDEGRAAVQDIFTRAPQGWVLAWPCIPGTRRPDIPAAIRRAVLARDNHRCVRCASIRHLQIDHIHPWSAGGEHAIENLQTLCRGCNIAKGAKLSATEGKG